MEVDQSASHPEPAGEAAGDPLEDLERRVLAMAEAYKAARLARQEAEAEASMLRNRLQERDMQIVLLKKQVEGDDLRTTVRSRVESLLKRIDELEREG